MKSQPKVYIITGSKNEGKTTLLGNVVRLLQERELETKGFLSEWVSESETKVDYYLTNINTGNQQLLCSTEPYPGWTPTSRFYFNPLIVEMGLELLLKQGKPSPDFYIIDEVGKFETQGMFWEPAIKELLKSDKAKIIWTTRDSNLNSVVNYFGLLNYRIFEASEMNAGEIIQSILY